MTQTIERIFGRPCVIELDMALIVALPGWADGLDVSKLLELAPDFTIIYCLIRVTQGYKQRSLQLLIFFATLCEVIISR